MDYLKILILKNSKWCIYFIYIKLLQHNNKLVQYVLSRENAEKDLIETFWKQSGKNKQFVSNRKQRFALDIFKLFQKTNDRKIDYPMSRSYLVWKQCTAVYWVCKIACETICVIDIVFSFNNAMMLKLNSYIKRIFSSTAQVEQN